MEGYARLYFLLHWVLFVKVSTWCTALWAEGSRTTRRQHRAWRCTILSKHYRRRKQLAVPDDCSCSTRLWCKLFGRRAFPWSCDNDCQPRRPLCFKVIDCGLSWQSHCQWPYLCSSAQGGSKDPRPAWRWESPETNVSYSNSCKDQVHSLWHHVDNHK